jgi:NAD+ kinase
MPPDLRNILVVPIAPHLSVDRAIIMAEGSSINMTVSSTHQVVLSLDGQPSIPLENEDVVTAYTSENTVQFVRFQDAGYFYRSLTSHMNQNPSTGVNTR